MDVKLRTERYRKLKPAEACAQAANDGKLKEWLQKMEPCAEKEQCQSAAEGEPLYVKRRETARPQRARGARDDDGKYSVYRIRCNLRNRRGLKAAANR